MGIPQWGTVIRQARLDKGFTQIDLADAVGTDQGTVSRWERNSLAISDEWKARLAGALGQPIEELFAWSQIVVAS